MHEVVAAAYDRLLSEALASGLSKVQAKRVAWEGLGRCPSCEEPIRRRGFNWRQLPDGRLGHIRCGAGDGRGRPLPKEERADHRDAVRLTVTRDGALR